MRLTTLPILALTLALSSTGHPTAINVDVPAKCKAPAIADCLRLLDLISSPNWKDLSFPVHPEGFSPVAYYGDCALAAVHTDGVIVAQMWGEVAEVVRGMVDEGLRGGGALPIAHDVDLGNKRTFALVLTVSAGDIRTWEDTVNGCMLDVTMGRRRVKPDQDQPSAFSLEFGDQYRSFRSEQQPTFHGLPTCGLVGVPPIDGSQYGCSAQAISSLPSNRQGGIPSAEPFQGNPFAQLIARCPHDTHWQCISSVGSVTCGCISSDKANVTNFEILAQLVANNNETVVSLFGLKCTKGETVSCHRIVLRPFECGCSQRRLSVLELTGYDGSQINQGPIDLPFQSVEWPMCDDKAHLKCCPTRSGTVCSCGKGTGCPKK